MANKTPLVLGTDGRPSLLQGGDVLGGYAPLASPTFTGTPAAPTPAVNNNSTLLATTAWVIGQGYAADSAVVHLTGTETIAGAKTFSGQIRIDSHYGTITADTDAATITFDMAVSDKHSVTLGGNRTLAVANVQVGQAFLIILKQDATGSRLISTWFTGILWPGGTLPTLSTGANKYDVFSFLKIDTTPTYLGFIVSQNH